MTTAKKNVFKMKNGPPLLKTSLNQLIGRFASARGGGPLCGTWVCCSDRRRTASSKASAHSPGLTITYWRWGSARSSGSVVWSTALDPTFKRIELLAAQRSRTLRHVPDVPGRSTAGRTCHLGGYIAQHEHEIARCDIVGYDQPARLVDHRRHTDKMVVTHSRLQTEFATVARGGVARAAAAEVAVGGEDVGLDPLEIRVIDGVDAQG